MVDSVNNGVGSVPVFPDKTRQKEPAQSSVEVSPQPQQASADVDVSVELSPAANSVQQAREVIDQTPAVRDERVAQIREQIANGDLKVNAQNIALQLLFE